MTRGEDGRDPDWLLPGEGLAALLSAGKQANRAASIIFQGLRQPAFLGRAREIVTIYPEGGRELREGPVWPGVWTYCPAPPLGSDFWLKGDIDVPHVEIPEGTGVQMPGGFIDVPLGGLLPAFQIRGLHIPAVAVAILGGGTGPSRPRGRRPGAGGYDLSDAPLVAEMHELRKAGSLTVHAAALEVAEKAVGRGTFESKVKRLMARYKKSFQNPLN